MSQLKLIIKNEYLTDIKAKSFWIATFLMPVIMVAFGVFIGFLAKDSDSLTKAANFAAPDSEEMTAAKALGMMLGMLLTLFIMMYGAQIFNKVKTEKTNRIVEILATCVDGRTMLMAKIIAVGLIGLTQLLLWFVLTGIIVGGLLVVFAPDISFDFLLHGMFWRSLIWSLLFFIGGYIFYGSLFAAVGAMTDKNNENQEYMSILTLLLLGAFYIGEYAVDHGDGVFATICMFLPFTSPTVGTVNAVGESSPFWMCLLSLVVLYLCAWLSIAFAGKIYTSSLLLKGKKFSPRDIITFLRSK